MNYRLISQRIILPFVAVIQLSFAFAQASKIRFTVSMPLPSNHEFVIRMDVDPGKIDSVDFKLPVWSPGYYQRLDYAKNLGAFSATDVNGNALRWEKKSENTWRVFGTKKAIRINYTITATRPFVATSFLDETHGYLIPASACLYPDGQLQQPVTIAIQPFKDWKQVSTGLEPVKGKPYTYFATDYDILYDSPLLIGQLESLTPFYVAGKEHRFEGYKLGEFDRAQFMDDLKKIVETASGMIGHIPYEHYTFIGIGPGQGGIEHLNSTTISFNGSGLQTREGRIRMLHFIAHEYYHHYNVKRIRPYELGPFDYDKGSRTNLLWVSEGLSVYYEYLVVKRAGLSTEEELIKALQGNLFAYESKPGRLYQSLSQASYETWSDGPFGRTGDEVNRTISYYDKGPIIGLMLDFAIRHYTNNAKSMDDVMRNVYNKFYLGFRRGFTDAEFQSACEEVAGRPLTELFEYVYTTKIPDYNKYLNYGGLQVDTAVRDQPGTWFGLSTRTRNDTVWVTQVEEDSPAWQAGIRARDQLVEVEGSSTNLTQLDQLTKTKQPGETIRLTIRKQNELKNIAITGSTKRAATFAISRIPQPDALQSTILKDWLK